jgi:hypothetical protein
MLRSSVRLALLASLLLVLTLVPSAVTHAFEAPKRAGFPVTLSGDRIRFGSPTLADLNGDGTLEIIVGGNDGNVYAIRHDGAVLWTYNLSGPINASANAQPGFVQSSKAIPIRDAPAVGDVTGDGVPEIAVGAGDVAELQTHGGVVLLSAAGKLLPGWPKITRDMIGTGAVNEIPDGYADGVVASPAIGDIDGDGVKEVVYGAFDQYVYARHANGSLLAGWPQFVLDTVWSSSALADLDGNGVADVVIGVDAHTYNGPPRSSQQGGDLYAFNGSGAILWRAHQDEIFQSSPAVGDIDGDGQPEVVAGTGTFYSNPPFSLPVGRYVSAWNNDGSLLWRTALPQRVTGSPAIGDVNGDGKLDVVVGALDGKVYAFNGSTGAILWSNLARDIFNNAGLGGNVQVFSPVLADYDGDGLDDVFIAIGWDVAVMKGTNGALLTGTSPGDTKPSYYGSYSLLGTPAVGDLDKDGKLDLVSASGTTTEPGRARVFSWRLGNSTTNASWPQFHRDAQHSGVYPQIRTTKSLTAIIKTGSSRSFPIAITRTDGQPLSWAVTENDSKNIVTLNRTSGTADDPLVVTLKAPGSEGTYTASLRVQGSGLAPVTISLTVVASDTVYDIFVPVTRR